MEKKFEPFKIFVVEDDRFYANLLAHTLSLNPEYEVTTYLSGEECLNNLYKSPDLVTLDYKLQEMNGERVLKAIKEFNSEIEVVIISGQEDVGTAVKLFKNGATDYIVKNDDTKERLWSCANIIREKVELKKELDDLREEVASKYDFSSIIGSSKAILKLKKLLHKAIDSNISISIFGETGTGKEVVAKSIHYNSSRSKKPFVAVNVAAIPTDLIESELFGHEKGAFTGAHVARKGKFEEAEGGTIFLDEIGEMDISLQAKLLRVIQEREVTPIGSSKSVSIDVRIVVATHRNLQDLVAKEKFREDLYYRLLGLPIELPPLRERRTDIQELAKFFAKEYARENGLPPFEFDKDAQIALDKYGFPGNVRELKAIVELACVLSDNQVIGKHDLSFNNSQVVNDLFSTEKSLKEYNMDILNHFLEKYENNILLVAKKLDIGKSTIYRMLKAE